MQVNANNIGPGFQVAGKELRYRDAFNETLKKRTRIR